LIVRIQRIWVVLENESEELGWQLLMDGDQAIACFGASLDHCCLRSQFLADAPSFWELELTDFVPDSGETCGAC
jgi:hypothetical protein